VVLDVPLKRTEATDQEQYDTDTDVREYDTHPDLVGQRVHEREHTWDILHRLLQASKQTAIQLVNQSIKH